MTKYLAVISLLASFALASYPALNLRNAGHQKRAFSARGAHIHLLGRGAHGLGVRQSGCDSGETPCGTDYCMPIGNVCCGGSGATSCYAGQWCVNGGASCCSPGDVACGAGCMPPGSVCCDNDADYCEAGQTCVSDGYCCDGDGCDGIIPSLTAGPAVTSPAGGAAASSSAPPVVTEAAPTLSTATPIETTTPVVVTTPAAPAATSTAEPVSSNIESEFSTPTTPETTPTATEAAPSTATSAGGAIPVIATMGSELMALVVVAAALF